MKRLIIFAAVLLFGLTSCKKDYTCKCEDSDGNVSVQTLQNVSKDDAEEICDDVENNNPFGASQECEVL